MFNCVVWMDHAQTKIFELDPKALKENIIVHHELKHHLGRDREENKHKNCDKYFAEVAERLQNAREVLLIGPGEAKEQFKGFVHHRHLESVAKKIIGTETVDHPTDGQIVALGKKFFKAHLNFE